MGGGPEASTFDWWFYGVGLVLGLGLVVAALIALLKAVFRPSVDAEPQSWSWYWYVITLFLIGDALAGENRPVIERAAKGALGAAFALGLIVDRIELRRQPERRAEPDQAGSSEER